MVATALLHVRSAPFWDHDARRSWWLSPADAAGVRVLRHGEGALVALSPEATRLLATAPTPAAMEQLVREALRRAGVRHVPAFSRADLDAVRAGVGGASFLGCVRPDLSG